MHGTQFTVHRTQGESPPTLPREHQHNGQRNHARPKGPGRRHLCFVCSSHTDVSLASGFLEFERKRKREVISESPLPLSRWLLLRSSSCRCPRLGLHGGPGCAKLGLKVTLGWYIITIIIIIALAVMTIAQTTMSVIQLDVTRKQAPWEKTSLPG